MTSCVILSIVFLRESSTNQIYHFAASVINLIGRWHEGNYFRQYDMAWPSFFISILIMTKLVELFGGRKKSMVMA